MKQIRFDDPGSVQQRALLLGHFSTVGDIQCLEFVKRCLTNTGLRYDVAAFGADVRSELKGAISPAMAEPRSYTHLVIICGPCWPGLLQNHNFDIDKYGHCKCIGINLTMVEPLSIWNPFDVLLERDSDAATRPDLTFLVGTNKVPVLGRCLIKSQHEYGSRQKHSKVIDSINDLIERRGLPVFDIDTRWPKASNAGRIGSPEGVSALIGVVDTLITNRLHGLAFALRNGVPVIAVDSVAAGDKVTAQARTLEWPVCLQADEATPEAMDAALNWCLTSDARAAVLHSRERAQRLLAGIELQISEMLAPVNHPMSISSDEIVHPGTSGYFSLRVPPPDKPTSAKPHFKSFGAGDAAKQSGWIEPDQLQITRSVGAKPATDRSALLRELIGLVGKPEPTEPAENDENKRDTISPRQLSSEIEFDADGDCRYARNDTHFARVAHIFHQNWHGIRSAAGVQPGHKVAIPLQRPLSRGDLMKLVTQLEEWGIRKAVFHGFSDAAERALRLVRAAGIECYLVWHGNLSQLAWNPEAQFFDRAIAICRRGIVRRVHMMKSGMGMVFPRSYEPMLLNCPPSTNRRRLVPAFSGNHKIALVPAFPDIRKNLHTSLLGAALSSSIQEILHYGKIHGGMPETARCKRVLYAGHHNHIAFLHDIDVSVNVTTIDCHPMVDMEALGAGAMALSGPLFLDALTEHPFTALSVIANPFNVREIGKRLDYLSSMNNSELQAIMSDYAAEITRVSRMRYAEFLNL
ncbi:polysaccharide pyruvyl transferase family protein [Hyphomicrobium sp.]|uniref:polysaccharide pyruvyl transferase family protein n=1 Tax=Hyphomicrobium sp. TaxID=82 RepID=UPI001DE68282|nr:polysaccharide pyruvyl transferase family protein [Hyphomicrobium sp.]MBY0561637.1 polysaccharide pyruvyl transferase family protein [Hyphomicrobium sp.]